ncbi:CpsB/CapC family capsule biosynthesis tyrosine phosphatase [Priestia endophytica]|uniref:CpsB/CapC family capsule biosynthesis tyrosine phosphatase n=1 Tax=Priestia endophytica TaxID=135735 RepID=UPI0018D542AF|nr:CpsB/CapC family capsule biosynthesis tyrosine phosphatase [Priestia endophytica]
MLKKARELRLLLNTHCHILHGADDGAENEAASLEMVREAVCEGITKIIVTPHHKNGRYHDRKEDILSKVKKLNNLLQQEDFPLTILPGQETRIYGEILENIKKDEILLLKERKGENLLHLMPNDSI